MIVKKLKLRDIYKLRRPDWIETRSMDDGGYFEGKETLPLNVRDWGDDYVIEIVYNHEENTLGVILDEDILKEERSGEKR